MLRYSKVKGNPKMSSGNLSFLEKIKVEFQHIITPDTLHSLSESSLASVDALLETMSRYSAIECLKMRAGIDLQEASLKEIFAALTKCWQNDLANIVRLTKPGDSVAQFITLFTKRYELLELLEALREISLNRRTVTRFPFISDWLLEKLIDAEGVQHIISVLRNYRSVPAMIVADALMLIPEGSIHELNVDSFRDSVIEEYWRSITSITHNIQPKVKFDKCLRNLKLIDVLESRVRKAFLEGKEISAEIPKLPLRISEAIEGSDPLEVDLTIAMLRYAMCVDEMVFSPLSHDVTLAYMVAKEYEALLLSSLIKSQALGMGKYFLEKVLSRWLDAYGKITSK